MSGFSYPSHGGRQAILQDVPGVVVDQLIDFSVNLHPAGEPPGVAAILETALSHRNQYPKTDYGDIEAQIAQQLAVDATQVVMGSGATELINFLMIDWLEDGPQKILVVEPTFSLYRFYAQAHGHSVVSLILKSEDQFAWTPEQLAALPVDVRAIFLGYPNNPTGQMAPSWVLDGLVAHCQKHQITLVIDLSFYFFCPPERSFPADCRDDLAAAEFNRPNLYDLLSTDAPVVLLASLTKWMALPDFRCGFLLSNQKALIQRLRSKLPFWRLPSYVQKVYQKALTERPIALAQCGVNFADLDYLYRAMQQLPLVPFPSCAPFMLFKIQKSVDLYTALLAHQPPLLVRHCGNFVGLDHTFFRVCLAQRMEYNILLEALANCLLESEKEG